MSKKVLAALSGGVDSSVAAALLVEAGFDVIGVTMQLWDYSQNEEQQCNPLDKFDTCCSLDDVADARLVASKLGIPFYVFDYQDDFKRDVVDYFTKEYLRGQTPNPCVACNTFLKFDHLLHRAQRLGCQFVATGHYAKITFDEANQEYSLIKGEDPQKDQSYFLYSLTQERLSKTLFPVGHLTKAEVRAIAEKYDLITAKKKESMEICFIPNNDYAKFIAKRTEQSEIIKGFIQHEDGTRLVEHDGIHHFTVGQRKGLGIAQGHPVFVTRIDPQTGTVFVGEESHLLRSGCRLRNFHVVSPSKMDLTRSDGEKTYDVKIRYRSKPCRASLQAVGEQVFLNFEEKQRSVTPGQIAVIYQGDEVVCGGVIDETFL